MPSRWEKGQRLFALACLGALLAGCGGGPGVPKPPAVLNSNLAGNWLLVGTVPVFPAPLRDGTRLAMTFSVDGTQLTGSGEYFVSCGDTGGGGSIRVQGTINSDGSFNAETGGSGLASTASLSLSGHVPTGAGAPWIASYAIDTTKAGSCQVQMQDSITAQPLPTFSGTYTGTGTYSDGTTRTPVSLQLALQQGVAVQDAAGNASTDMVLLSGTVTMTGVPCFGHGSVLLPVSPLTLQGGSVWGDSIHPSFKMDDGSSLFLNATLSTITGSDLPQTTAVVLGGDCGSTTGGLQASSSLRITDLTRVN